MKMECMDKVSEAIKNGEHRREALIHDGRLGTPDEVRGTLMRMYLRGMTKVWDDGRMVDLA